MGIKVHYEVLSVGTHIVDTRLQHPHMYIQTIWNQTNIHVCELFVTLSLNTEAHTQNKCDASIGLLDSTCYHLIF